MADILSILRLKIYEVVNGSDHYLYDDDWYVPIYEDSINVTSSLLNGAIAAANECGIPYRATLFYMKDRIVPTLLDSANMVDITQFKGKTIKCVIKNFEPELSFILTFPIWSDSESVYSVNPSMKLYRGGILVTSSQNPSGQINNALSCTNTFRWDPLATENGSSLRFVDKNGNSTMSYFHVEFTNPSPGVYENKKYQDARAFSSFDGELFVTWLNGYTPITPDDDNPYWDGGTSDIGGGGGNFSEDSDDVDVDSLPSLTAPGTGMATLFTPNATQLRHLADVMWNSNFFTFMQNLVENISNMFTSLAIVPFNVLESGTVSVTWLGFDTAVDLTLAARQFYEFDMGSIDLANDDRIFTSGSALDYSPYSRLGIFLPFIGFQELDIDECRGAVLHLKYRIDILSGTCVALISVDGNTIYQFTGNCLSQIPITNENMQSLVSDAVNVGIAACATHSAVGAASADMAAAKGSEGISEGVKDAKIAHAQAHVASSAGQLTSATANAAMGMKPTFGKAGAISASASLLAVKQPYLFLTTPRQSIPEHYQRYCGFPSNISGKLSSFSGFTVVEDIRLNGLIATSNEVSEIYDLLKKGVII